MTITAITLTNPGAESGNLTGWTITSGFPTSTTSQFHTGTHAFSGSGISDGPGGLYQQKDVSAFATAIDAGTAAFKAAAWLKSTQSGSSYLYIEAYSASLEFLGRYKTHASAPSSWTQQSIITSLKAGTRFLRIGYYATGGGTDTGKYWDDFTLEVSDDGVTDYGVTSETRVLQTAAYGLVSEPSENIAVQQAPVLSVEASETSSGLYKLFSSQFVAYALVKKHGDKRKLRAWTFPQDDHKFYVLQLGNSNGTLIYDQLTQQWARWQSPSEVFWRGEDGCDWEGFNVACDPLTGKIFKIDPEGRLDYNDTTDTEDTPITSIVVGGTTERFRKNVPCYMAELAISEGQPPEGIDATTVSISLRSNDTLTTYDHGNVPGTITGDRVTVRWYGLGLMGSPGRVFEITDTGYARRIDGLNIEVGDQGGPQ